MTGSKQANQQRQRVGRLEGTLSDERVAADMARSDAIFALITAFKALPEVPSAERLPTAQCFMLSTKIGHHKSTPISKAVQDLRIRAGVTPEALALGLHIDVSDVESLEDGGYGLVGGSAIERVAVFLTEHLVRHAVFEEHIIDVTDVVSSTGLESLLALPVDIDATKQFIRETTSDLLLRNDERQS